MRLKKASIALATAAVCGLATLGAPAANAYELKIDGDVCTYNITIQDIKDKGAILKPLVPAAVSDLKEILPNSSDEIDEFMKTTLTDLNNAEKVMYLLNTIDSDAVNKGFYPEEIAGFLTALSMMTNESNAQYLQPTSQSITKQDAKKLQATTVFSEGSEAQSVAYQQFIDRIYNEETTIFKASHEYFQNCVGGNAGNHKFNTGGNVGGDNGGNTSSSFFSFGSS
ncbi:hypothetical protein SFC07_10185 [Corynebacterium callunae]|uniref:hypothetical protein n=1 Tax=Corynebacterium callunae TaxID=1721 RepID=UPI0039825B40